MISPTADGNHKGVPGWGLLLPPIEKIPKLLRNPKIFFAGYLHRSLLAVVSAVPEPWAAVHVIEDRSGICRMIGGAGVHKTVIHQKAVTDIRERIDTRHLRCLALGRQVAPEPKA